MSRDNKIPDSKPESQEPANPILSMSVFPKDALLSHKSAEKPDSEFTKDFRQFLRNDPLNYSKEWMEKSFEACKLLDEAEAKCNDCVYLEADKEIINEHIEKHVHSDKQISQLEARLKELETDKENLAETILRIDNYCRTNDIDIEQALKGG